MRKEKLTQFLGYLIHRINYMSAKNIAEIGKNIFCGERKEEKTIFDENEAIGLMHELTLAKYQIIKLKVYLTSKGIYFPNQCDWLTARKNLRPLIKSEFDGNGVSVCYTDLFEQTTKSIIETINSTGSVIDNSKELKAVYKDGGDGSGSQTIWKSVSMISASDHIFQCSMVPVR